MSRRQVILSITAPMVPGVELLSEELDDSLFS